MKKAKNGDTVKVHYHGKLTDGSTFDSSKGREPLEFTVGAGMMIRGFDKGVVDMEEGQVKTINISADEAYGEKDENAIINFPKSNVPDDMKLEPGMQLQLRDQNGHPINVVVEAIGDEFIILDANHPLAGKELIFEIEMVEIS